MAFVLLLLISNVGVRAQQMTQPSLTPKFNLEKSGLELERPTRAGAFLDVVGRRAGVFGYEHRALEAWVYPLQVLDDLELSFQLEGYPLEYRGADIASRINVRPEATTITYSHAAFTVRQIIFAPVGEPGIVMLLEVQSTLPLVVNVSFRPRLKLMWPAGLMTGSPGWDEQERAYFISEETNRYVGLIGSPAARDISVMPYQEEPRDVPARFHIDAAPGALKSSFVPIIITGSVRGREDARASYRRLLGSVQTLYEKTVLYYRRLLEETTGVRTPDAQLDEAYSWAKVGIDKGVVDNPLLGTGLVAGFRTAGQSERPGFAWFFGRDSLWTAFALNSYGDFTTARTALEFLRRFQRADGKIPHEISQSASLIAWFTDYPYAWASADATPLYIIAHADLLRASGDLSFTRAHWDSILKAYRFTAATDADANGLIENTNVGHGWVEGGALYPPHEEIYMQGIWVEALRSLAEMAEALKETTLATEASAAAERTRAATEQTYWLPDRKFYAFATNQPRAERRTAERGPNRERRQARMDALDRVRLVDEDTVLPAVPLWWGVLDEMRAQDEIDHLGSGHMATDWGARIITDESQLYDPLSYHHGSVWPLFTGWASVGAYRYGRASVGWQALKANALLTRAGALGYVTELLSGDFNASFGRSSHHQIWSEAMVVTPLLRGLLGLEVERGGGVLRFAPQLPVDWKSLEVSRVAFGTALFDFALARQPGRMSIRVRRRDAASNGAALVLLAPAFPLDAQLKSVTANGQPAQSQITRLGDVQRVAVRIDAARETEVVFNYEEGSEVYFDVEAPADGARSEGLRVLRSRAEDGALRLLLEGVAGRTYTLRLRSPHQAGEAAGVRVTREAGRDQQLTFTFEGAGDDYVRREFVVPLQARKPIPTP